MPSVGPFERICNHHASSRLSIVALLLLLSAYAASVAPARVPVVDLGHVPYACILIDALAGWRAAHGGAPPRTRDEKKTFKEAVRRRGGEGGGS